MTVSKYNFPSPIKSNSFIIDDFSGVDFTTIESKVDLKRSPDSNNMIVGKTGSLDKRTGRKVVSSFPSGEKIVAMQPIQFSYNLFDDPITPVTYTNYIKEVNLIVTFGSTYAKVYLENSTQELKLLSESGTVYSLVPFVQAKAHSNGEIRKVRFIKLTNYQYLMIGLPKSYIICISADNLAFTDSFLPSGATRYSETVTGYIMDFQASTALQYVNCYTPTTAIGRKPDGSLSTKYEDRNFMSSWIKNEFLADGTSKDFKLTESIDNTALTKVYKKVSGDWVLQTSGYTVTNADGKGKVSFTTAPAVPTVVGEDNIRVEFTIYTASAITNLFTHYAYYGYNGKNDFAFVSYKALAGTGIYNRDFRIKCDKKYLLSESFTDVGERIAEIMGYSLFSGYLVTHCINLGGNPTLFLRSASVDDNGVEIFPMQTGKVGYGAASSDAFANLWGDTIWLSENGVVGLVTNEITNTQAVQDRSYFINGLLNKLSKTNLRESLGIVWDNRFYLFTTDGCFVADPRKKSVERLAQSENFQYDWTYFKEIKAHSVAVLKDKLQFAYDNHIYEFRTDADSYNEIYMDTYKKGFTVWANATNYTEEDIVSNDSKYYICLKAHTSETTTRNTLNEKYWNEVVRVSDTEFLAPVVAYWTTPIMNMSNITVKKTLKNLWVRLEKYTHTGVRIYYATQGIVKERYDGIFDFSNLDFSRFSFSTDTDPMVVVTNRQERKFMSIQFKIESRDNTPMSLLEIVGKYTINNQYKG